jgi:DNA-binding NarL/FixJ family response regulator
MNSNTDVKIFSEEEWDILINELSLSPRQGEIIHLLLNGHSDKQVALKLDIAVPTVRTHLSRLFSKLDLQDRTELILHVFCHFRKGCPKKGNGNGCSHWLSHHIQ